MKILRESTGQPKSLNYSRFKKKNPCEARQKGKAFQGDGQPLYIMD